MPKSTFGDDLGQSLQADIQGDGATIAAKLQAELATGATNLTRDGFLQMLGRNWQDSDYRQALLQRIGPDQFISAYKDAQGKGYVPPDQVPQPLPPPMPSEPYQVPPQQPPPMPQGPPPMAPMSGNVAPGQAPPGMPGMGGP